MLHSPVRRRRAVDVGQRRIQIYSRALYAEAIPQTESGLRPLLSPPLNWEHHNKDCLAKDEDPMWDLGLCFERNTLLNVRQLARSPRGCAHAPLPCCAISMRASHCHTQTLRRLSQSTPRNTESLSLRQREISKI